VQKQYVQALLLEIKEQKEKYKDRQIISIYFGGGTPSLLDEKYIADILSCLYETFYVAKDAEISIEINPGTANKDKLLSYKNKGINRLSIGLQSALDKELKLLGRIHNFEQFEETYRIARKIGFDNINIDLISALPGQNKEDYLYSLKKVASLNPEHISAYSLILEEGTYLYDHKDEYEWVDEDTDRILYELTGKLLSDNGYDRYEISNYAKKGYECIHNKVYWQRGDYLGLGLGASSLIDNVRFKNTDDIDIYLRMPKDFESVTKLSIDEQMEEFMFLGLRLTEGVLEQDFFDYFGKDIDEIYGAQIEKLISDGLLLRDERIKLTEYGLDVSNYVFTKFLL